MSQSRRDYGGAAGREGYYRERNYMHTLNGRGVKMFSTKTSRDVGMVDDVSDATGSSMKKQAGLKSPGKRRCSVAV